MGWGTKKQKNCATGIPDGRVKAMLATKTNRLIKYFSSCSREIHKSQSLVASDSKRRFQKWGIDPYRGLGGVKAPLHIVLSVTFFFFFFFHTSTFQLLDKPCGHKCRPFSPPPPPVLAFNFVSRIPCRIQQSHCSSVFSSRSVANSRPRAVRKSICAQEKSLRIYTSMHSGGARTHETNLYQARG